MMNLSGMALEVLSAEHKVRVANGILDQEGSETAFVQKFNINSNNQHFATLFLAGKMTMLTFIFNSFIFN
jgi:hypothetical protein